ncbi:hypothetical protein M3650_07160 [Paenibacillus sp. MER TA 81-3]|uniref:hypothetical protein n=1 Tax=Paenibacillus sp. MER TA 81-3 TaxID=2939573 RepID=UPI0020402B2F|nr:hypothetical protein [Paenibacillus sp. MER TA 81-3]MCM3338412.1 hypothetical protein [Paenibacillus sp. MER TA 81-3]
MAASIATTERRTPQLNTDAIHSIPFFQYTWNTVIIAALSVFGVTMIAPIVAYGFAKIGVFLLYSFEYLTI